ncbi:MAG TPA: YdcF family protein [Rhodanobacteraceae bacterium]
MSFPLYATSPLPYSLALLVVLAACWRRCPRSVRVVGVVVEILLVALMTPIGAHALARALAASVPPPGSCVAPRPTTIVVLGGGFENVPRSDIDFGALHLVTLERAFAGIALWHRIPDARLVFSGGAGSGTHEAPVMANLAMQMGVPARAISIDPTSRNTWENARNVAALSPAVPRRIWLVSSAMHLPRALGAFHAFGFQPCAWPTGLAVTRLHVWYGAFIPDGGSARTSAMALHEVFGGWDYAVKEWWKRRHAPAHHTL